MLSQTLVINLDDESVTQALIENKNYNKKLASFLTKLMIERSILILTVLSALSLFAHGFDHPRVHCQTTKGPLTIEVYRDWSPLGADRFLELVKDDFYTNISFFRCVKRFLTQFGISDNPTKKHWHRKEIQDDPNLHLGIKKNYVSYAGGGPNSRSTQLFIAFEDLDFLGNEPWETPFGMCLSTVITYCR